ncbi:MAG: hypothetical protein FWE91_08570 [Defluviitaleaceae bacterium]|nr:hypothetical protein [Defluviitaleaceae bacterium]MCL2835258.1 hypothetical protein [Defluviitaleaceae bacterium]
MADIKHLFREYDFGRLKKMIFLNAESFFSFIDIGYEPGETGLSFKEIIEAIEPFIPLVISDDCLEAYLLTALSRDSEELERLQNQFMQNAKIKFVKNIFNARSDADLEEIFDICRTIRDYKEKSGG